MSLKDVSYLELWNHLCSLEWNYLCNFGRRHHEEQFCEYLMDNEGNLLNLHAFIQSTSIKQLFDSGKELLNASKSL